MGELPGHLSMMLVLSDKYHLEVDFREPPGGP